MKYIIGAYTTLMFLALNIMLCITVANVSGRMSAAKEYKADVIAEIENSNFNRSVMDGCIRQAKILGYELQITDCVYDERNDIQTAEVIVSYRYEIPFLGIDGMMITRGIAR